MNKTSQEEVNQTVFPSFMVDENTNPEEEEADEELSTKKNKCDIMAGSKRDIKFLSKGLILAMLYIALNLDESEIQLSHLYRFIHEKHLDILNPNKFVPDDINVKKIPQWINFIRSKLCTQHQVRALTMSLLRKLNLGTPRVPDLKKIIDIFLTELCLPSDMKPLIYSLMHLCKCNYLDIDNEAKKHLIRIPDYEGTVMSYILVTIKICFGLDGYYEVKLSDVVEKINNERDYSKSYKLGKYSDASDRLFSFSEWCRYLQFRKVMLCKYNLRMAEQNGLDVDDYVYLEQMEERPKNNEELPDKIAMGIISKLPQEYPYGVISKELFIPTVTPMSEYTDIIIDHCQDPEIKLLLAEDFKRYSSKYACESLDLTDLNMGNVVEGVGTDNKRVNKFISTTIVTKKAKTNMVYVKNCENRNWMKTNPPTMEHVTCVELGNETNDKESDHGYDSENTSKEKDIDGAADRSVTDQSVIYKSTKDDNVSKEEMKKQIIAEEDADKNIFDDGFEDINHKEECEQNYNDGPMNENDDEGNDEALNNFPSEDFDRRSDISDECDSTVPLFNPDTFDRERTIKELILLACRKYKAPIPVEYRTKEPRKRKENMISDVGHTPFIKPKRAKYEGKVTEKELINNYYSYIQSDFVTKVQQEMSLAVRASELENQYLQENNDRLSTISQISAVESNSMAENGLETPINQSDRNSLVRLNDEQSSNLDVNKTDVNNKPTEIDENLERTLFEDDEEMELNDVMPKGDPHFDEEKYETDQLYMKVKEEPEVIHFDIKDDLDLNEILSRKIEEFKFSTEFAQLTSKPGEKCVTIIEDSDSEDDIPLSVFKEEAELIDDMFRQEENYERLINKDDIPEYKFWIRHYDPDFMLRSTEWHTKFNEELKENTPSTFYFVIQECASILNCSNFHLYKHMQTLENHLICKAKNSQITVQDNSISENHVESPE